MFIRFRVALTISAAAITAAGPSPIPLLNGLPPSSPSGASATGENPPSNPLPSVTKPADVCGEKSASAYRHRPQDCSIGKGETCVPSHAAMPPTG
jgi:hypothetical protein